MVAFEVALALIPEPTYVALEPVPILVEQVFSLYRLTVTVSAEAPPMIAGVDVVVEGLDGLALEKVGAVGGVLS